MDKTILDSGPKSNNGAADFSATKAQGDFLAGIGQIKSEGLSINDLRQAFGLTSIKDNSGERRVARRKVADEFIKKYRTYDPDKNIKVERGEPFSSFEERYKLIEEQILPTLEHKRKNAIVSLVKKGVANPEKVLRFLEVINFSTLKYFTPDGQIIKAYDLSSDLSSFYYYSVEIPRQYQTEQFYKLLGENPQVMEAHNLDKIRRLTGSFHYTSGYNFVSDVLKLSQIPDDQFSASLEQLKEFTFFWPSGFDQFANPNLDRLIGIIAQCPLSDAQLETLRALKRESLITGGSLLEKHPTLAKNSVEELFANGQRYQDELSIYEYIIHETMKGAEGGNRQNEVEGLRYSIGDRDVFFNINYLAEQGQLSNCVKAIDWGWECGAESFLRGTTRNVLDGIDMVFSKLSSSEGGEPDELEGFLKDYFKAENNDEIDTYNLGGIKIALRPGNKKAIKEALVLAARLAETPQERRKLFSKFYTYGRLDYDNIRESIELEKLPESDHQFWKFLLGHTSYDEVSAFLLNNKDKFSTYVQEAVENGQPVKQLTYAFLLEGLEYAKGLPKSSSREKSTELKFLTTFFDDDNCPNDLYNVKYLFNFFRYPSRAEEHHAMKLGETFFLNYGHEFLKGGVPNYSLLVNYLAKNNAQRLLGGDIGSGDKNIISLLSEKEQNFWNKCLSLEDKFREEALKEIGTNGGLTDQSSVWLDFFITVPQKCAWMTDEKMEPVKEFVTENIQMFLKDNKDIDFINQVVGISGSRSLDIFKGYVDCIKAGVITAEDRKIFLDFVNRFRAVSPAIIGGYKQAVESGQAEIYISRLLSISDKLIASSDISEEERKVPFFKDLVRHVYPNNSGQWGSYERVEECSDRSGDLAEFKIEPRYQIDLLSQSLVRLRQGELVDSQVLIDLQKPIYAVQRKLQEAGGDVEQLKKNLGVNIDQYFTELVKRGVFEGIDRASLSVEQNFFLILSESIYHENGIDLNLLKDLMITYEFAYFEDIAGFIQGTNDRVYGASNRDYALLCELSQFYSDKIKEVNKRLVTAGFGNPQVEEQMKKYFAMLGSSNQSQSRQEKLNRMQVKKLGMSQDFVTQVRKILEVRNNRKYSEEEVQKIIAKYEGVTHGLSEKSSSSTNLHTKKLYGMLRSQRERSFEALKLIAGKDTDPKSIHLGEINLQEALNSELQILKGEYDREEFASYTAQRFIDIFEEERGVTEGNLQKFESEKGTKREVLNAYFTKTKESANARMVGGVCVSKDNPDRGKKNLWDMSNYFQLVFQDPGNFQCQGLVLLHHFTDKNGKRILTASLNPSSTYLYSVDEGALFSGIMGVLEKFALGNNFDVVAVSKNSSIRTNRAGGEFEKAIDKRIKDVNKEYSFDEGKVFSYMPSYRLKDMDVVWSALEPEAGIEPAA
ncbi:MAG: hypothetical protein HYW86_04905 [Candidatus Roizmanbacteria bacterium]|nr:MAG: hypothetical protein HYW86_04905 [Candidatus Roizmanbacteria bacterium]